MKKRITSVLAISFIAVFGLVGCNSTQPSNLNSVEPTYVGLSWQECPVTKGSATEGFDWEQAEICFGHSMPLWNDEDKVNFGIRTDRESLRLTIGKDVYETRVSDNDFPSQKYTLYKNGETVISLYGEFTTYSPNVTLQNIGGKAIWEYSDEKSATIIYDGVDVRSLYGLDKAYRPYGLNGKLIFVGEKDNNFFIVYDGQKVGMVFDKVMIAYCCEPVLWSVQYGKGKYLFWASRKEQWYIVETSYSQK